MTGGSFTDVNQYSDVQANVAPTGLDAELLPSSIIVDSGVASGSTRTVFASLEGRDLALTQDISGQPDYLVISAISLAGNQNIEVSLDWAEVV